MGLSSDSSPQHQTVCAQAREVGDWEISQDIGSKWPGEQEIEATGRRAKSDISEQEHIRSRLQGLQCGIGGASFGVETTS